MNRSKTVRIGLLVAIVAVTVFLFARYDVQALLRDLLAWIEAQGAVGVLVFIATYVAATVFFIPGSILTLGAGFVFGVAWGTLWVSIASISGAVLALLVGRYLMRGWVESKIAGSERFRAIDEAVGREGAKIVFLTRLSPIFPFNLLNYAYGLTRVGVFPYFLASWIGMLPGTVMYVYFGSAAANLATLGSAAGERNPLQWVLYGVGFFATVAVTIFVTRLARRALTNVVGEEGSS